MEKVNKAVTANTIKLLAIAAMLIDHIAWAFVPFDSAAGQIMHIIGRITAPTMCYFIAEGYYHTHNVKKYAVRLGIFAVLSYLPFIFFETGSLFPTTENFMTFNVIYTLLCSLLALWAWDKITNDILRILTIVGLCIIASPGDWSFFAVLFTLAFGVNHGDFKKQVKWFSFMALYMVAASTLNMLLMNKPFYGQLFQLGVFLCLPLLALYNGQRGGGKYSKWIFYIFYPVHLLILGIIAISVK